MVQRMQIILEDDIDGGEATETLRFGLDGVQYEIDLSEKNAKKLREALAPWQGHARKISGRRRAAATTSGSSGSGNANDIRAWAQANGYKVSDRGRIPAEVREAFQRANS